MQVAIVNQKRRIYQQVVDSTTYVPFLYNLVDLSFPCNVTGEQVN